MAATKRGKRSIAIAIPPAFITAALKHTPDTAGV
jgi:hypothetical protein